MILLRELAVFAVVCLASFLVGRAFQAVRLPAITGYLVTGALAGPFVLEMLPASATTDLRFVDEISLAVIAMVAGTELLFRELKPRKRAIGGTVAGIVVFGYFVLATAIFSISPLLPFTSDFDGGARLALALLGAAVLLALSPPSAIAVIKEVEARGRFTRTVLGVTVLMDVVIIVLFAVVTSLASPLLEGTSLELGFILLLIADLGSALLLGYLAGKLIARLMAMPWGVAIKAVAVLALGFGIYELADFVKAASTDRLGFEIYIEPLLISLIAGLYVANFSTKREAFDDVLHDVGPLVYVAFFTITGISLKLDLLVAVLPFAIGLFVVRLAGIALGAYVGARFAGEPKRYRRYSWMAYVTQAGIALGLAREVAVQFPSLGDAFATLVVSVVVINEVLGPLFLKAALRGVGESHERTPRSDEGRVLIFGRGSEAVEVGRVLEAEGRETTVVRVGEGHDPDQSSGLVFVESTTDDDLNRVFAEDVVGVIAMLEDDEANSRILRYAAEEVGLSRLVVRPSAAAANGSLDVDGAVVVHPVTGMVALLAQAVETPNALTLLLDHNKGREVVQMTLTNADLDGATVADLRLPEGVLLMEIRRDDSVILVDGRTRLRLGDELTLVSDDGARAEMRLAFAR